MYIIVITKRKLAPKRWKTCDGIWRAKSLKELENHDWHMMDEVMFKINKNERCQLP